MSTLTGSNELSRELYVVKQKKKKRTNESRIVVTPEQQQRADIERAFRHVETGETERKEEEKELKKKKKTNDDDDDEDDIVIEDDDDDDGAVMLYPFTGLDLLREMWTPQFTPLRNMRLMMAAVRSKRAKLEIFRFSWDAERRERCKREADFICEILREMQETWLCSGPVRSVSCTADEVIEVIREQSSRQLYLTLYVKGFLTEESLHDWVRYYKDYVINLVEAATDMATGDSRDVAGAEERKEKEEVTGGGGLDALFVECRQTNRDVVQQFVTRLKNGRMVTVKSPGEKGSELVRLQVYDIKEILHREPRTWWKHAKLRAQFISSDSERKRQLLRDLLDQAADELRTLPGIVRDSQQVVVED